MPDTTGTGINRFTVPVARVAGPQSYSALTDCQICIVESLKIDGPELDGLLRNRINRELSAAGILWHQLYNSREFQDALDGLEASWHIARDADGKLYAQLDLL